MMITQAHKTCFTVTAVGFIEGITSDDRGFEIGDREFRFDRECPPSIIKADDGTTRVVSGLPKWMCSSVIPTIVSATHTHESLVKVVSCRHSTSHIWVSGCDYLARGRGKALIHVKRGGTMSVLIRPNLGLRLTQEVWGLTLEEITLAEFTLSAVNEVFDRLRRIAMIDDEMERYWEERISLHQIVEMLGIENQEVRKILIEYCFTHLEPRLYREVERNIETRLMQEQELLRELVDRRQEEWSAVA